MFDGRRRWQCRKRRSNLISRVPIVRRVTVALTVRPIGALLPPASERAAAAALADWPTLIPAALISCHLQASAPRSHSDQAGQPGWAPARPRPALALAGVRK